MSNVSMILGAGISIAAGMPTTTNITDVVINATDVRRETSDRYVISKREVNPYLDYEYIKQIQKLIEFIKLELDLYYHDYSISFKKVNYEDIYYLINEMYQELSGEIDNPELKPFMINLEEKVKPFLIRKSQHDNRVRFYDLLNESIKYIRDIVKHMLQTKDKKIDYLNFILDMNNDTRIKLINIFTLNHDTLLEEFLDKNVLYNYDFLPKDSTNIRYWDPNIDKKQKITLYKLHGSINWYRLRIEGRSDWFDEKIGIVNGNPDRISREGIGSQFSPDNRPKILVGSFNKLSEYRNDIFAQLQAEFYNKMANTDLLIISGYGFGDSAINTRIIEWVYSRKGNRIILIHPSPHELKENARGAIANKWDDWLKSNILNIVNNWIEFIQYDDIQKVLNKKQ